LAAWGFSLASALAILLAVIGGKAALALLPVVVGLTAAHSAGAVGAVLGAMTIAQKIAAVELAIQKAPEVLSILQNLDPVVQDIVAGAQSDAQLLHTRFSHSHPTTKLQAGQIVAVIHGGPTGWGRAPVHFVYQ
jgi:hypothetical protein